MLRREQDSARLMLGGGVTGCVVLYLILIKSYKRRGYAMPIELLVPIALFFGGVIVSITLGGIGIQRVAEANKK